MSLGKESNACSLFSSNENFMGSLAAKTDVEKYVNSPLIECPEKVFLLKNIKCIIYPFISSPFIPCKFFLILLKNDWEITLIILSTAFNANSAHFWKFFYEDFASVCHSTNFCSTGQNVFNGPTQGCRSSKGFGQRCVCETCPFFSLRIHQNGLPELKHILEFVTAGNIHFWYVCLSLDVYKVEAGKKY